MAEGAARWRVAYDARGGGLGHVRRALAILGAWRAINPRLEVLVLCSSAHPSPLLAAGWPLVRLPGAYEAEGRPELATLAPAVLQAAGPFNLLVVDSFPEGLLGEWGQPGALEAFPKKALIARPGAQLAAGPEAWKAYDLALVPQAHSPWPEAQAVGPILATRPEEALTRAQARAVLRVPDEAPLILVPLGGDPGEALAAALLADEASKLLEAEGFAHHLRFVGPQPPPHWGPDARLLIHDPLAEVLQGAEVVLGAAGANLVAELQAFGLRAVLRPLKRSHDDQAWRAQGWRQLPPEASPAATALALREALESPAQPPWTKTPDGALAAAQVLDALMP